jgi:hypothetical protein
LLLALQLEDEDLVAASLAQNLGGDLRAAEIFGELALLAREGEDVGELDLALFVGRALDLERVAGSDAVLFGLLRT